MAALKYWLWISTRRGVGPQQVGRLLEHFGTPERAYYADPEEYGWWRAWLPTAGVPCWTSPWSGWTHLGDCDRLGVRILTMGMPTIPTG